MLLDDFAVVDTGDPLPAGYDAVMMREHVHHTPDGRAEMRAAVPPYQHVRSIGEDISAGELLLPAGHRLRPVDLAACAAAGVTTLEVRRGPGRRSSRPATRSGRSARELAPGEILDTNSLMLAAQAARGRLRGAGRRRSSPDDPELIAAAVREAADRGDLVMVIAGSSAGRDDYTAGWSRPTACWPCTASRSGPGTRSCWAPSGEARRCSAPPATRCRPR